MQLIKYSAASRLNGSARCCLPSGIAACLLSNPGCQERIVPPVLLPLLPPHSTQKLHFKLILMVPKTLSMFKCSYHLPATTCANYCFTTSP